MPIYEYQCTECHGRFQRLVRGFADPSDLACPRCHSANVSRQISQVAHLRGESAHADALLSDTQFAGVDDNDPRALAAWAKQLGQSVGDDAGNWNEMVDEMIEDEFSSPAQPRTDNDLGWA